MSSFSVARMQLTLLTVLSLVAAVIFGLLLLYMGLSVGNPGEEASLETIATISAFTMTGVGALLLSFAAFAVGVTLSLLQIFKALEPEQADS